MHKPAEASTDFVGKWGNDFRSINWGQENYELKIRKRLKEPVQLEEDESIVFAASSGGWLIWVQHADETEAGLAHAMMGTNRRLIIWTSRAPDFELSRFRELRYRDFKEVRELTELRVGKNLHQFDGIVRISFRDKDEVLGILAGKNATPPMLGFLNAASNAPTAVAVDRFPGRGGLADHRGERRDMTRESLLQMLEDLASKVRSLELEKRQAAAKIAALERERNEAVATARALEREAGELVSLVTLAGEKVEEILGIGADDDASQPQATSVPVESKTRERMGEFSAEPQRELKERSGKAWRFE